MKKNKVLMGFLIVMGASVTFIIFQSSIESRYNNYPRAIEITGIDKKKAIELCQKEIVSADKYCKIENDSIVTCKWQSLNSKKELEDYYTMKFTIHSIPDGIKIIASSELDDPSANDVNNAWVQLIETNYRKSK